MVVGKSYINSLFEKVILAIFSFCEHDCNGDAIFIMPKQKVPPEKFHNDFFHFGHLNLFDWRILATEEVYNESF